jgi:Domain of unknown function (DUF5668)
MKSQHIFPGVILIGFGLYFFMQQNSMTLFSGFYSWPTLLGIVGIAFLLQAYMGKEFESILPGVILFGFGLHFHVVGKLEIWPNDIGVFILIIALGFILRGNKTKKGMFHGILLLIVSILLLFYDRIFKMMGVLENGMDTALKFWPFVLVAIGLYVMFVRKK